MAQSQKLLRNLVRPGYAGRHWWCEDRAPSMVTGHRHCELELNLTIRGSAAYLVDGARYDLRPGVLIWLFPAQDHLLIGQSPDFAMWVAVFRPAMLRRVCTDAASTELLGERPAGLFCKQLTEDPTGRLDRLLAEMLEFTEDAPRYNAALAYAVLSAWALHCRSADVPAGSDLHPAVERAARLLRDEIDPLPVPILARRAGLSPAHLSRLFRRQIGQTIVDYRQQRQLERFFAIYRAGRRHNMTQAALAAGFGSYPQFHRVFRRHLGQGPAEYRRQRRKEGVSE